MTDNRSAIQFYSASTGVWSIAAFVITGVLIVALLLAIVLTLREKRQNRRSLEHMSFMLDAAIEGRKEDMIYDESLLSSVEAKLAHFLLASEVSARNLAEEKNKIKELISDISHQTKTPISNILLYSQLLGERELSKEERSCVSALNVQAEKLSFLIGNLVKISRLETGILSVAPVREELAKMLQTVWVQAKPKADKKEISLIFEETSRQAVFDLKWTAEALYNIVDNAIKYTKSGGTVRIKVKSYEMFQRMDITDDGMGIRESDMAQIFKRFYRSNDAREEEGTGLGLFLAREIISSEGGYIKVASVCGEGSTFSVFLPREVI